ncbi:tRNA (adenosine(37)-N6)-threonylcarbamoyltransferase complex dimerization subunit type 1 TsaB [Rhizobium sp. CRIBSB]|nr:tRNA (adenosine(37)-N6)-threonylcarbamoyltransferase complex dimerization subunit type 1 TsaB [Rhizobium sp. CRIBSB]
MKGLVIDTALGMCTVVAFDGSQLLGVRSELMARGHQERLGGFLRDLAETTGGFAGLDRIGVTIGPGSFTGLRVGMAFAQGLGAALDRPVVGVSTLDALAAGLEGSGPVAALIDARRGQVYARFWRDGDPLGPAQALSLDEASNRLAELVDVRVVGSGASLFETHPAVASIHPADGPGPRELATLTLGADAVDTPLHPLYLRAPDATPPGRLPGQARP